MSLRVPVCFCIFNRPDTTARVFQAIRRARPSRLLVVSDGPRTDVVGEVERVNRSRAIASRVDWNCRVETCYSDVNLGCGRRMASGLSWAFDRAESLIVLEDDCVPAPSFFDFCESLLDRYSADQRVMMISGDNFYRDPAVEASYYFSTWGHIWGWASWRDRWQKFQLDINDWWKYRTCRELEKWLGDQNQAEFWENIFDSVAQGKIDTWDYSWQYALFRHRGLVALPNQNLVSNIGHDERATHTRDPNCRFANLPTSPMERIEHPGRVVRNDVADAWTFRNLFRPSTPADQGRRNKKWWPRPFRFRKSA